MKTLFNFLFNRWILTFLGFIAVALLIWYVGPLIAVADYRPLESEMVRLALISALILLYLGKLAWKAIKAKKLNDRLMEGLLRHPTSPTPPTDSAGAAEVEVLRKRFEEAVSVLKQADLGGRVKKNPLLSLLTGRQYVYELPWYIFIGPPGSGKTTALVNSGLQFPLAERFGQEVVHGIGGTRNCDWWFTDEAVLLDTAGRYTTQESSHEADSAAWSGFLQLLKKFRPRRPINGVIVTVSVPDLLEQTQAQREAQANAIRKRIQELHEQLNIQFPVYVLVTKADLLAGFMEFFGEYGREERSQVWGATFPFEEKQNSPALENFNSELAALEQRLNDRLIDRLQQERDIQKRALLYAFPQQFHALKEVLDSFLDQVFSPSRFEQQPLLRGFYFTSGTQEGNPIDRMMGGLARTLHLERKLLPPHKPSGKSFFLTRLIKNVIFAEAELAGTNLRWERNRAALQWGMFAIAGLITAGALAAWSISYSNNKAYLEKIKEKIPPILHKVEDVPATQSVDIVSLLPILESVKDLARDEPGKNSKVPLSMGFGLYQGEKLTEAANAAYQRLLQDAFLPQIALRIERLLNTGGQENPELLYEVLKAYLMLYDPRHFDPEALKAFITTDWKISLPREVTVEQRQQLEAHLDNLLARGQLSSPIPINQQLVANVRNTVSQVPISQRIYNRIKRLGVGTGIPAFTIAKAGGPSAPLMFTRASGQPLTQGVPGLFSYDGYYQAFLPALKEVAKQLADEEGWVLGLKEKNAGRWLAPEGQRRLMDDVRRLYLEDYASTWSAFINDLRLIRPDSLQKSIQMARLLSAPDSPLILLIRAIVKETTLADVEESSKTIIDKATDKAKSVRDRLELLLGQTDRKTTGTSAPESRLENIVDDRFRDLRNMVRAPAPGQPAPIDGIPAQINELYILLTATEAAIRGGGSPPQSDVPTKIKADAGRMPEPVRSMLVNLATGSVSQALGETRTNLDHALKESLGNFCRQAITGRYPFVKSSAQDVTQSDFARLFAPGGLLDDFFQKNLAQYVDTSVQPWRFKKLGDANMGGASSALQEFQRARVIRDVFFPGGSRTLSIDLTFKPIEMDASITQFILDMDGKLVRYSHGPQVPVTFQWQPKDSSQVRLQISPPGASGGSAKVFEGPWALFRMLDGM